MRTPARWNKCLTWVAAWVLGLAALAPWVSHMLAGPQPGGASGASVWLMQAQAQAICTAQNDQSQPADTLGWQDHCPMCTLPQLGLPPVPEQPLHVVALPKLSLLPPLYAHAHSPLFAWAAPPSRAPPHLVA